jgi:hypothetical protein
MKWLILVLLVVTNISGAYETTTHSLISNEAISLSNLVQDPELLINFGLILDEGVSEEAFPGNVPSDPNGSNPNDTINLFRTSIERILSGGAVLEDAGSLSIHHFFDPQNGGSGSSVGRRSPDWSLESVVTPGNGDEINITLANQDFSYKDALEYFYLALTSSDEENRLVNFGLMFRSLGHVIHHLQDMAQPQHVRSDGHCDSLNDFPSLALFCFLVGKHNPSYYENYTNTRFNDNPVSFTTSEVPQLASARDFWENSDHSGIAEYTSRNFVSAGTNYQGDDEGTISNHPDFPNPSPLPTTVPINLPDLLNEDPRLSEVQKQLLLQKLGCHDEFENICVVDFIQNEVTDIGEPTLLNTRSGTVSIFDEEIRSRNIEITSHYLSTFITKRLVSLNRFNFESAYPFLLPRAVAYSSGMINHFFRGRLQEESVGWMDEENVSLVIKNTSSNDEAFNNGSFEIFYEDSDGNRKPVQPVSIQESGLPLVSEESTNLTFPYPEDVNEDLEQPFVIVFNGEIGEETGIATIKFSQPISGVVDELFLVADQCPEKRFAVSINFKEQPENNGQVVIKGKQSGLSVDFTDVPSGGELTIVNNIYRVHFFSTGGYTYSFGITPGGFSEDTCSTPSVGAWIPGEQAVPINPLVTTM